MIGHPFYTAANCKDTTFLFKKAGNPKKRRHNYGGAVAKL